MLGHMCVNHSDNAPPYWSIFRKSDVQYFRLQQGVYCVCPRHDKIIVLEFLREFNDYLDI